MRITHQRRMPRDEQPINNTTRSWLRSPFTLYRVHRCRMCSVPEHPVGDGPELAGRWVERFPVALRQDQFTLVVVCRTDHLLGVDGAVRVRLRELAVSSGSGSPADSVFRGYCGAVKIRIFLRAICLGCVACDGREVVVVAQHSQPVVCGSRGDDEIDR